MTIYAKISPKPFFDFWTRYLQVQLFQQLFLPLKQKPFCRNQASPFYRTLNSSRYGICVFPIQIQQNLIGRGFWPIPEFGPFFIFLYPKLALEILIHYAICALTKPFSPFFPEFLESIFYCLFQKNIGSDAPGRWKHSYDWLSRCRYFQISRDETHLYITRALDRL